MVPNTFYVNYPFRDVDRTRLLEILLESYTLIRMAGFDAVFIRETDLPPAQVKLLLVPFADLLSPTWRKLHEWVKAGGVLWAGFGGAIPNMEELFGVWPGWPSDIFAPPLQLVEAFGDLRAGEKLTVPATRLPYLPIVPTKARVLAVDGNGHPAVTLHTVGQGKAFFSPCSLEWLLTLGAEPNRRLLAYRLYRALRSEAGIVLPFETGQPALSLSVLENEEGEKLLVAINHSDNSLEEEVRFRKTPRHAADIESGEELEIKEGAFRLSLGPWGVRVLKIEG